MPAQRNSVSCARQYAQKREQSAAKKSHPLAVLRPPEQHAVYRELPTWLQVSDDDARGGQDFHVMPARSIHGSDPAPACAEKSILCRLLARLRRGDASIQTVVPVARRLQLFVDDSIIQSSCGVCTYGSRAKTCSPGFV